MAGAADCRCRSPPLGEILHHVGVASPSPDHVVDLDADRHVSPCGRPVHFVLSFSNLTYSVPNPKRCSLPLPLHRLRHRLPFDHVTAKTLLSSISGEAREGEILAVLGASGSGKSTLIDALADRISKDSLKGSVTLNGEPLDSRLLRSISAYVMQDDLLFPMLTVEETLTFSAEFRLPRSLSAARKRLRVQSLIDQLGLRAAATTIIGDEGHRGISGGERRRVSIGVDIIHDPVILFLDEPTSGLDSSSAFLVVNVLRRIAESGSVVIMTVHQPSYRILGLLDHLIFLSRGEMVFSGGVGELGEYFAEFGRPIPEDENKAEFALDLIRELENKSSSADSSSLVDFHRKWRQSRTPTTTTATAAAASFSLTDAISASISRGKLVSSIPHFANPLHIEVGVLTKRSFTNTRRMPELFAMRLATVLVTGFILATVFWRLDESPRGVQERLGFFAFAMSTMFYTCADALPVFLHERYIFARETAYNAYRRSSYVLSNSIVAFPPLLLLSLAFASTTFFAVGLAGGAGGFFYYLLIILASFWSGSGFVTFLSGVVSHVMVGYTLVVAILAYFLLFSGFFINRDRIPGYWIWFHYLSLVKYPYEGVLHNEFGREGECFVKGTQMFDNSPIGGMSAEVKGRVMGAIGEVLGVRITGETCFTTGKEVLVEQGIGEMGKWECLLVTVAWGFLFRLLFYLTLVLGRKDRRR